jgi:ATP-binding cassette, subfamily B, bacterial
MSKSTEKTVRSDRRIYKNILYMLGKVLEWDLRQLFLGLARVPVIVLLPLSAIFLSSTLVTFIVNRRSPGEFILVIAALSACLFVLSAVERFTRAKLYWRGNLMRYRYMNLCSEKLMDADYASIENPDGQEKTQRAIRLFDSYKPIDGLGWREVGAEQIVLAIAEFAANVVGMLVYATIISKLNPWIVLFLVLVTYVDYLVGKNLAKWNFENKKNWAPIDRKINYFKTIAGDFAKAKDIRLYQMKDWFSSILGELLIERKHWYNVVEKRSIGNDFLSAGIGLVREAVCIGYLVFRMYYYGLSAGDFVLYFGVISGFSAWLLNVSYNARAVGNCGLEFSDFKDFVAIPQGRKPRGKRKAPGETPKIEFRNVWFGYPATSKETIEDFDLTIEKGEKLAIVGLNGAGKTTLVKLLCGLYVPTKGEILIDGIPAGEFDEKEYFSMFSAVFQDIHLLPASIEKNIALCNAEYVNSDRFDEVVALSGLSTKIQLLGTGKETGLMRGIVEDSIDLSGGEKQKLALARALYKDGKVFILDEPTAALDPIAENELYLKYKDLAMDRTAIFISHRLSSTRFCDRIIFLEAGKIVEAGSHDCLIRANGKYAEMYDIQSRHYRKAIEVGAGNDEN